MVGWNRCVQESLCLGLERLCIKSEPGTRILLIMPPDFEAAGPLLLPGTQTVPPNQIDFG